MVAVVLVVTDECSILVVLDWVALQDLIFRCCPIGLVHVHWGEKLQVLEYIERWILTWMDSRQATRTNNFPLFILLVISLLGCLVKSRAKVPNPIHQCSICYIAFYMLNKYVPYHTYVNLNSATPITTWPMAPPNTSHYMIIMMQ